MSEKTKILVLDDEPIVGERLKASLELAGFAVDAFSSSRLALEKLQTEKYDILVTDLKMSGPDGMEVLRAERSREILPRHKIGCHHGICHDRNGRTGPEKRGGQVCRQTVQAKPAQRVASGAVRERREFK